MLIIAKEYGPGLWVAFVSLLQKFRKNFWYSYHVLKDKAIFIQDPAHAKHGNTFKWPREGLGWLFYVAIFFRCKMNLLHFKGTKENS